MKENQKICFICGKKFKENEIVKGESIRAQIRGQILKSKPDWQPSDFICHSDLSIFRMGYIQSLLKSEKGELSDLEVEVLNSIKAHELVSSNIDSEVESDKTFGQILADRIAVFGGSWTFLITFGFFLFLWILANSIVFMWKPVDPYPYILLNLVLSCLASIQAPIIMMSQNRRDAKDSLRSQHDYQVNLKAELEIRQLHEKMDHLLSNQWERLVEIQEIQMELLTELVSKK